LESRANKDLIAVANNDDSGDDKVVGRKEKRIMLCGGLIVPDVPVCGNIRQQNRQEDG
jgi:hypothetical protein